MQPAKQISPNIAVQRVGWLFGFVVFVMAVFLVRTFYLQVIRHEFFRQAALSDQLKQYEIPAIRGAISAHNGSQTVPIVLNQKLYTLYADPTLIKDASKSADLLASVLGGQASDYEAKLKSKNTSYVVISKRVDADKKNQIIKRKYPGIGAQEVTYRTYPNGSLAAQMLGFVNADGKGVYGVEQALNKELAGKAGKLKAVTDINGVPLAANTSNIQIAAEPGKDITLTIDMAMQQQVEKILQEGLKKAKSDSGSLIVMDPNTGAVKAMANWPTYDPGNYVEVKDANVFNNAVVSSSLEVGSIMKPLTTAAALDQGVIRADQTYSDPASWVVDEFKITNIEEDGGPGQKSIADILNLSLNTGAVWELMQMGKPGGTEINQKGREAWFDYMSNHYRFGKETGIEQGYEDAGTIPDPNKGYARDLTYANTSFGQAMTATPLQMAAAFSAIINGGVYYQPHIVESTTDADGKTVTNAPKVLDPKVVSPQVSKELQSLLEYVVQKHYIRPAFNQDLYSVGGKTGTAQIAKQGGGYKDKDFNGTYLGFIGGDKPDYVIMVRVNEPKNGGYAGTAAAQPIFATTGHMLIDNFGITPKGQ